MSQPNKVEGQPLHALPMPPVGDARDFGASSSIPGGAARIETQAWGHVLTGIVRQKHDKPSVGLADGDYEELVRRSDVTALLLSQSAQIERLTKERDEAHKIAKKLTRTLVDLTPSGSEYFTRCILLDDYFADPEACTKVIRERFQSGHQAKIDRVDERRRAETAEARALTLQQEVDRLRELVERAFRDGLAYGSNVASADVDLAWSHSSVLAAMEQKP